MVRFWKQSGNSEECVLCQSESPEEDLFPKDENCERKKVFRFKLELQSRSNQHYTQFAYKAKISRKSWKPAASHFAAEDFQKLRNLLFFEEWVRIFHIMTKRGLLKT